MKDKQTNNPYFSIMLPVYNGEDLIAEAIESVFQQPYADWELIIMNDGSTDNTLTICEAYAKKDSRIRIYSHENVGLGKNRNLGFVHLSGKWTVFLDHDDMILENFLTSELVSFLQKCELSEIELVVPARLVVDYDVRFGKKEEVPFDAIMTGGCKASWNINHEFATCLYHTELLMRHNIRFHETRPEMESIFRHKAAYLAKKVMFSNGFYFGVRRENPLSVTNQWKYLNVIPLRFTAYQELEEWHKHFHKKDPMVLMETKQRTIEIVTEFLVHSVKNNVSFSDIIAAFKANGMQTYITACIKEYKFKNMWMHAMIYVPRLYLFYLRWSLRHTNPINPDPVQLVSYEFLSKDKDKFPSVYLDLEKQLPVQ